MEVFILVAGSLVSVLFICLKSIVPLLEKNRQLKKMLDEKNTVEAEVVDFDVSENDDDSRTYFRVVSFMFNGENKRAKIDEPLKVPPMVGERLHIYLSPDDHEFVSLNVLEDLSRNHGAVLLLSIMVFVILILVGYRVCDIY